MTTAHFQDSPDGPRYAPEPDPGPRAGEPVFNNSAWPVLALVGALVGGFALQSLDGAGGAVMALAFVPGDLTHGRWWTLFTSQFLHGGWAHVLMNAAFILAFGTPVARFFGLRLGGALIFYGFYLACGALAALGFAALHPNQPVALIGASGAASGLMGAAARLIAGQGRVGPVLSRTVLGMGAAWLIVNLILAVVGAAIVPGAGDAAVGWEAHIAGFLAGVLILWPFARLARRA
jgi:membrane associated rhomboid family serine protease